MESLVDRACAQQLSTFMLFAHPSIGTHTDRDGLTIIETGRPMGLLNGVLDTHITDPKALGPAIAFVTEYFAERDLQFLWWTRPTTEPSDLADQLLAAGYRPEGEQPVMTHSLVDPSPARPVDGLAIRAVATDEFAVYGDLLVRGFEMPAFVGDLFVMLLREIGGGPDAQARTFIGSLDGEDVATASVFFHGDTAGIYNISTLSPARGRGVGAAMTLAAEDAARARGFDLATLQSSSSGYGVYEALGYEEICKFKMFTPTPSA